MILRRADAGQTFSLSSLISSHKTRYGHARELVELIQSEQFFAGRYAGRVIQVDSSKTGAEEDEMVERLLRVEHTDEPTEIVVHVNMFKEGWDVTNLYTIVPLRAANARILIEQSIGRGLQLPYGKRTGVASVDRLNIVAYDRFQEIVDEANRPNSPIRLQRLILDPEMLEDKTVTVVSQPNVAVSLGLQPVGTPLTPAEAATEGRPASGGEPPVFRTQEERKVAQIAYEVMRKMECRPEQLPSVTYLAHPDVQEEILHEVKGSIVLNSCHWMD